MALSFKLAPSSKPKELKKSAIDDNSAVTTTTEDIDYVTGVSKNKIKSTKPEVKKEEVIIPCAKDGFKLALEECFREKGKLSSEEAAISALMKDADAFAGKAEEEAKAANVIIPAVPEPEDNGGDIISRQVTIGDAADYDAVSIDDFGMAMIRGMGFKEGEGIGKTNKVAVKPIEVTVRPKGQGLGASSSRKVVVATNQASRDDDDLQEVIELKKGARCVVIGGPHKEKYATVDGLDAENGRVIIHLAIGDKVLSVPESNVKTVSDKEFERSKRYINKASADQVRLETEKKLMTMRTTSPNGRDRDGEHRRGREGDDKKNRHRSRSRSHSSERSHHRRHRHDDKKSNGSSSREEVVRWLHPNLSVMITSGKYVDQKATITDVLTPTTCSLRLQGGKSVYDVEMSQLLPVQPRRVGDACMALTGQNRRLIGEIMELDANGKYAVVQSAADQMIIVSEKLSNLCVYTGSLDF